jgi:Tfp pilus assembly protein PilF
LIHPRHGSIGREITLHAVEYLTKSREWVSRCLFSRGVDNGALFEAIDTYRKALLLASSSQRSLDWVRTQNNLGTALLSLGQRESGTAKLEEAVCSPTETSPESTTSNGGIS